MTSLYWRTFGEGKLDLVLLHGWGLNAEVWGCITDRLAPHFRLHLVDLPGYGRSQDFGVLSLHQMAEVVLEKAPQQAVWLGWSMGGLVASKMALIAPERVQALISVASSPCFCARDEEKWPGIRADVLRGFEKQLSGNFEQTVAQFMALQTLGAPDAYNDAKKLNQVVLNYPMPKVSVLHGGLRLLAENDLRQALVNLPVPLLRIYGSLDGLVPRRIVPQLDALWPQSRSVLINHAAHAPFISHPDEFCQQVISFTREFLPAEKD
ncbi:pimeloyl-ACP methyl ester esterase BioH [Budviciaceae bacterium CWB-B4]|uniref:Pimeloyl-[acyl-carrier protein] methyl ester esterase n=1 Tax=Limnobaculum xujianqingii TaxID=2738837 RepID=A0A9D7AK05_9GAMM|nr:pimeloyl-ACP methyl ester esterase BioH [Limnobaculum xujianqingii]MBK5074302.1 pimeloyl-ACP methyl ester esterase BioH [Limnobaculum xujianqingii]MBK5177611.1 pimeloyl-ACP methyl ester esterase BioH [Limnobaculum xujianqingii]